MVPFPFDLCNIKVLDVSSSLPPSEILQFLIVTNKQVFNALVNLDFLKVAHKIQNLATHVDDRYRRCVTCYIFGENWTN